MEKQWGLLRFAFFCGEDVGGVSCGDFIGSVYADCVDYEVRRREVGEEDRGWGWECIVYYCI